MGINECVKEFQMLTRLVNLSNKLFEIINILFQLTCILVATIAVLLLLLVIGAAVGFSVKQDIEAAGKSNL